MCAPISISRSSRAATKRSAGCTANTIPPPSLPSPNRLRAAFPGCGVTADLITASRETQEDTPPRSISCGRLPFPSPRVSLFRAPGDEGGRHARTGDHRGESRARPMGADARQTDAAGQYLAQNVGRELEVCLRPKQTAAASATRKLRGQWLSGIWACAAL